MNKNPLAVNICGFEGEDSEGPQPGSVFHG